MDLTNDKLKLSGTFDEYQRRLSSVQQAKAKEGESHKANANKLAELEAAKAALAKERDGILAELTNVKEELSNTVGQLDSLKSSNIELASKHEEIASSSRSRESELQSQLEALQILLAQEKMSLEEQVRSKETELETGVGAQAAAQQAEKRRVRFRLGNEVVEHWDDTEQGRV